MKFLFISHETSRTGAPMVLLHFMKWLRVNKDNIQVDLLALNGGALENEFKSVCHNYYNLYEVTKPKKLNLWHRIFLKLGWIKKTDHKANLLLELSRNNYEVVYANTVVSIPIAHQLISRYKKIPFIAHIHELNAIIKIMTPNFDSYTSLIDQFIVPSHLVKENLINNRSILINKIAVVYECAEIDLKTKHQLEPNKDKVFTIGASGTVDWRKGHDVFIQLARYVHSKNNALNFKCVWVGRINAQDQIIIEADIEKLGLKEKVIFVGEQEDPYLYFKDFDVFVMTSREDPFPLVCIEVAMMGKPIISFDKAVGTNEILEKAGGFIVPYLSIESMAEKIVEYYNNPILIEQHGSINKKVFSQFTPELICPQYYSIIEKHLNT